MGDLTRPFAVDFYSPRALESIEVRIDFQSFPSADARVAVQEIMTVFAALGASGGLGGSEIDPTRASIRLTSSNLNGAHGHWVFGTVRIDAASICILLNMIHWLHLETTLVERVHFGWPINCLPKDPLAIQFPSLWPHLSFSLEVGDLLGDVDLEIELQHPQPEAVADKIVNTMAQWLLATHRGAYANDSFDPAQSRVYLGPDVMSVKPQRIVWFIDTLRCDESALDGILNLLDWVSQKIARIGHVNLGL